MEKVTLEITEELEVKRFYVPSHDITVKCPKCNEDVTSDLVGEDYLSYPMVGEEIEWYAECDKCETEIVMPIKLTGIKIEFEYDITKVEKLDE